LSPSERCSTTLALVTGIDARDSAPSRAGVGDERFIAAPLLRETLPEQLERIQHEVGQHRRDDAALAESSIVDSFKTELIADRVWRTAPSSSYVVEYISWFIPTTDCTSRSARPRSSRLSPPAAA
jgi:hypothetical protein